MDINRMRNYTKQKLMVGTLCAVMSMPATADDIDHINVASDDVVSIPGTLSAAVPWNIIGEYTAGSIRTEKFFRPAIDCKLISTSDMLIQLEHCKSIRKGWLKI